MSPIPDYNLQKSFTYFVGESVIQRVYQVTDVGVIVTLMLLVNVLGFLGS